MLIYLCISVCGREGSVLVCHTKKWGFPCVILHLIPFAISLLYSLFHFCSKSLSMTMLQIIFPPLRAITHFSVKNFPQCFVLINQTMISLPASLYIHVVHPSDMFSHSFIPHILHGHTMSDTMICTKYLNIQGMLHTTDMPPDLMNHIFGQD